MEGAIIKKVTNGEIVSDACNVCQVINKILTYVFRINRSLDATLANFVFEIMRFVKNISTSENILDTRIQLKVNTTPDSSSPLSTMLLLLYFQLRF